MQITVAPRSFDVPPSRRALPGLCALLALAALPAAQAQTPPLQQQPAGQAEPPQRVYITGSSIRRIDAEGALPITSITREEIDRIGAVTASDLLRRLPQSGNQGASQAGTRGGFTPGGESIALRDLGPNATLVLLNGRRLPNYPFSSASASFVSLDQIPAAAIARVEILKDGASAIYGSDAVAGVVNFITRKNYDGLETTFRYGDAERGDPREVAVSLAGGFGKLEHDGWNALFTIEHLDRTMLRQADRSYTATNDTRSRGGYDRRNVYQVPANAQATSGGTLFPSPGCAPADLKGSLCYNDFSKYGVLVPESRRTSFTGLFTARLTPAVELFGELLAGHQTSRSIFSPDLLSGRQPTLRTARGNPFGVDVVAIGQIPGTPLREEIVTSDSARVLAGARGDVGSVNWEAAVAYGRGQTESRFTGQLITTATAAALLAGDVSPFGTVANDPDRVAALLGSNERTSTVKTSEADARASMPLFGLPAGAVEGAAGVSYRKETLDDATDPKVTTFLNGVNYGRRDGSRTIGSGYVELLVPAWTGLELQLSARTDHYSDFGNTTNPKLALRWKALPDLAFRASYSEGFRAPSLSQIVQGNTVAFTNGARDPQRCPVTGLQTDCSGTFNIVIGGNKDLQPETSKSWTAGLVFQWGQNFEATLDRYDIDYRNQIYTPDRDTILRNELISTGNLVTRKPATAADIAAGIPGVIDTIRTVPANLAVTQVKGWDLELKVRLGAGELGNFVFSGAATYVEKLLEQTDTSVPLQDVIGTFTKPRTRITSALDWSRGPWSTRLAARYTGGYEDGEVSSFAGVGRLKIPGYTQLDAQLGLKAWRGGSVALGVTNLADKRAPYSNATGSGNAPNGDLIGRAYYLTVRHAFR